MQHDATDFLGRRCGRNLSQETCLFLSQRILAEDEKFLPEKLHVIFIGIVYLLRGENKVGCISGFFYAEFYLSRSR